MKKQLKKLVLSKDTLLQLDGSTLRNSVVGASLFTCRFENNGGVCVNLDETSMWPGCPV